MSVWTRVGPKQGGSFENFLADLGVRPEGTVLGRIDKLDSGRSERRSMRVRL